METLSRRIASAVFGLALIAGFFAVPVRADASPADDSGAVGAEPDTDGDGLSDRAEREVYFTDPTKADTDGDGYADNEELRHGYSPRHAGGVQLLDVDTDGDGASDGWELAQVTSIMNPDTDGDGFKDGEEMMDGYSPRDARPLRLAKVIRVDAASHHLTYYLGDRPLESFAISAGKPSTPTPRGEFAVMQKLPVVRYVGAGYDYPNTKWNMLFTRKNGHGYYVHGAYWHSKWGRGVSGGCVNVPYERMERLYAWAEVGTKVVVVDGKE